MKMPAQIAPKAVRYIKLGWHGMWEKECLENGIIRLGFGTEQPRRFLLGQKRNWDNLKRSFVDEGKALKEAARFTGEISQFFEYDGGTLWITFHDGRMHWGFLDSQTGPKKHPDGTGVWRIIVDGWKSEDLNGEPLIRNRLSAAVTKLAGFPGTSCNVRAGDYVIRRINRTMASQARRVLLKSSAQLLFPDQVEPVGKLPDGALRQVFVNAYERNPKARRRCIKCHGATCYICAFDFGQVYGAVADGFIHVHHLRELSQLGGEYKVDPENDLRPVCPNCHAVLHRKKPAYTIEEVQGFLKKPK
jgi:hypothetical protein